MRAIVADTVMNEVVEIACQSYGVGSFGFKFHCISCPGCKWRGTSSYQPDTGKLKIKAVPLDLYFGCKAAKLCLLMFGLRTCCLRPHRGLAYDL